MFRFTGKAIWNINKHFKLQGTIGTDINSMNFEDFIAKTTPGTPAGKLTDQIFNNRTLNAEILALYNNSWGDFDVNATAGGNINKHLKLQGTIGTDINSMNFQEFIAKTTPGTPAGKLTDQIFNNRTLNAEILALYNNSWGDFDVNATAGGNIFKVNNKTTTNIGLNQQINGIQNIMNYQEQNTRESMYKKQISSLYASASLGYKHTYYLEGTLRGDKSSTLPTNNNTYVYPSVSGSLVFSEFIKNKKFINYGKIRASWAKVGSDTDPYLLARNYTTGKYSYTGYTIGMIANSTQPNKDLKPTMTGSYEVGLEMKFLNGRLGLDATYYNQNSKDQILSLASTTASGYAYRLINAGEIQNQGVEIALNARALQIKDFAWDLGVNFSKNTNKAMLTASSMPVRFRTRVSRLPSMPVPCRSRTSLGTWVSTSRRIPTR